MSRQVEELDSSMFWRSMWC